ncbi:hypothetical protein AALO_G00072180 [Alosa alosa]|uniref:Uncharacterized protein n=1 Tax=Alosa alosa TaxID=278164 RepID=A0AAV6H6K4_9TELE|nr:hypothetical protein AALO_G00072180 [Alosa alosa]
MTSRCCCPLWRSTRTSVGPVVGTNPRLPPGAGMTRLGPLDPFPAGRIWDYCWSARLVRSLTCPRRTGVLLLSFGTASVPFSSVHAAPRCLMVCSPRPPPSVRLPPLHHHHHHWHLLSLQPNPTQPSPVQPNTT